MDRRKRRGKKMKWGGKGKEEGKRRGKKGNGKGKLEGKGDTAK